MRFNRLFIVALVLFTSSIVWAGGAKNLQQIILKRNAGGGGPPPGTLLVGDNTAYSTATIYASPDIVYSHESGVTGTTAVASGELVKGYCYIDNWWDCGAGEFFKMIVYLESDGSLIAESAGVECTTVSAGWIEFTFSSGSITSGTAYHLTVMTDDSIKIFHNGDASSILADNSGSYASPPDPVIAPSNSAVGGKLGGMYVTN